MFGNNDLFTTAIVAIVLLCLINCCCCGNNNGLADVAGVAGASTGKNGC